MLLPATFAPVRKEAWHICETAVTGFCKGFRHLCLCIAGRCLMSKKRIFLFFLSIVLLIISEYLLLNELMGGDNTLLLLLSSGGLLTSVFFIIQFYKEWRNSIK